MASFAKIDCHAHFVPPFYREALIQNGHSHPDGMPAAPAWTANDHLDMMSQLNITKSVLSISSPGTYLINGNDSFGRKLARQCNDYAANLKKENPAKFGFWASLPLPDTQGSLDEIAYALDEIDADGFTLETNFHGIYLGDARYDTVFAELNRRRAKLFIHPTTPCLSIPTAGTSPATTNANPLSRYPRPMLEFFFDTARAVTNLFVSGTVERYPDITYVIPHAGGAFPPLINRMSYMAPGLGLTDTGSLPNASLETFPTFVRNRLNSQFYFDTAGWSLPEQLTDLLQYVDAGRVVYGSDYPWSPLPVVAGLSRAHDQYLPQIFPEETDVVNVCKGNAEKLLARE